MQSDEYGEDYFRKTRNSVGLLLKTRRPLWWRWVKIIRKYKKTGRLLDIGCGEGYFLQCAEHYYDTYGMDVSEYGIEEAKRRANRTELSVGSIRNMDFSKECFDIITCFDVLEHLENPEAAILECRRVLKAGGLFVVRVPNTLSAGCKWKKDEWFGYRDRTHFTLLSNEEWLHLLSKHGFLVLKVFYDGLWDTPYIKGIPKIIQDMLIKFPTLMLFFLGMNFSERYGENLCMVAQKRN